MPPPFAVTLVAHDPRWAEAAAAEAAGLHVLLGPLLEAVHHIGSTAVPGLRAKPILDLLPVVGDLRGLDRRRADLESVGFAWWGEFGLPGRCYATKDEPRSGRRLVQLHCYATGSPEIVRHLAVRDYLRRRPDTTAAYEREKVRCHAQHTNDSHQYGACKSAFIDAVEAAALAELRSA